MPKTAMRNAAEDEPEVVKWYTRARRFPQLIGKTPSGENIWGGPYTYTQVAVGVGLVVLGSKTTWLWGHFGLIGNALVLFAAAYGVVLLIGRAPIGSRNPLAVAAGVLRAMSAPSHGNLAGRPVRLHRAHRAQSRLVITPDAPTLPDLVFTQAASRAGLTDPAHHEAPSSRSTPRAQRSRWQWWLRPDPAAPAPGSASTTVTALPALTALTARSPGASHGAANAAVNSSAASAAPRSSRTAVPTALAVPTPAPALTGVQRLLATSGAGQVPLARKD